MKKLIDLIGKVKTFNSYNNIFKDISNENFNMFRICGVNHYENTHSSILVELLRNDSSHNFGNSFLEAFIETLKKENRLEEGYRFNMSNVKVIPEYTIPGGRIDIFIKNDSQCIIIENKIYAVDQFEQLKKYEAYAKEEYKESYLLMYLTLWGSVASEGSGYGVNYLQISYEHIITKWLEKCVEISARNPLVRETLIQYINHIKSLTNTNIQSKMDYEIIKLLSERENLEATFTIGENLDNVKNHLINKVFLPKLDEVCKKLKLTCEMKEFDRVNTAYSKFNITNPAWKYFKIACEFETKGLRNFIIGINHISDDRNEETFNKLKQYFKWNNQDWVWSVFPKYNSYWGKEAMIAILDNEMAGIFEDEIKRILKVTSELEM